MRLIDADALKHSHCVECTLYPDNCLGKECDWGEIYHIDHAPTVDAEPVRHGRWYRAPLEQVGHPNFIYMMRRCSECGGVFDRKTNYCPSCGAKMDLEKKK